MTHIYGKQPYLTITWHIKGKAAPVCSLQACSCRQWGLGTEKAVAFRSGVCLVCVCLQPPNPTAGCRDNILWGQPGVLPTSWHFWQPLIEPRVLNYSYRCYWERLPFSQEKRNPHMNCGCLSLRVNTVVMIWGSGDFLAKWQSIPCQFTCWKLIHLTASLARGNLLNLISLGFLFWQKSIWHAAVCFSAIFFVIMEIPNIWYSRWPLFTNTSFTQTCFINYFLMVSGLSACSVTHKLCLEVHHAQLCHLTEYATLKPCWICQVQ